MASAELLYLLGEEEIALEAYNRVLKCDEPMARVHALNSIELIGGNPERFLESCLAVLENYEVLERQYDARIIKWLIQKWGIDPAEHGVEFTW